LNKLIPILIVALFWHGLVFSESKIQNNLDQYFLQLKQLEFQQAVESLKSYDPKYKEQLTILAEIISQDGQTTNPTLFSKIESLNYQSDDSFSLSIIHLINGYYKLISSDTRPEAFSEFSEAYQYAKLTNYNPLIKQCLLAILKLYRSGVLQNDKSFNIYLEHYKSLSEDNSDLTYYYSYKFKLYAQTQLFVEVNPTNDSLFKSIFIKFDSVIKLLNPNNKLRILYNYDKGNISIDNNADTAISYYKQALKLCDSTVFYNALKFDLWIFLSRAEAQKENYADALRHVKKASLYKREIDSLKDLFAINAYKAEYYSKLKKYDSAFYLLRASRYFEYQLNFQKQNSQISVLEVELGTAEKEKQILIEQQQKKKISTIAFVLAGLVLFGSITFMLVQKNTKRKQLIAEQEKELETQKLATVLKEQELTSIDAMIEGQEKERQRIANDLHDDLGGLMATIKLHFNALKEKPSPELYDKTTLLLDNAYDKVRSIAHTKNSGVMAKKGLLKAINDMAKTISESNKLQIDVVDYGLENRLENSLELTIFRIVQELVTNIIKHAEASEATIHITNHNDSLNIMVEDNGKGFNTKTLRNSSGMGIHSIEKRIENLEGTVTIESEISKGTTIIIDIPS